MKITNGSKEQFQNDLIAKSKTIHGDKYDYSKVKYINAKTKVCIICPIHGEFWTLLWTHANGVCCPKCAGVYPVSFEEYVEKANNKHNNKYTYIESTYNGTKSKLGIICKEHGLFYQVASSHLMGCGCPKCKGGVRLTNEEYIKKAIEINGTYYDYSKVKYINAKTKVCIICPRHGEFWQEASSHLYGKGCPKCKSSVLENILIGAFKTHNVFYQYQYKLKNMGRKSYDFYLPDINVMIECQGEQHFVPINFNKRHNDESADDKLKERIRLDIEKYDMAIKNNIQLVYFIKTSTFRTKDVDINTELYRNKIVFNNEDDLLSYIKSFDIVKNDDNDVIFRNELLTITEDLIYQNNCYVNKNHKIYLIKCNKNNRDDLNHIARINRKSNYKSLFIFEDEWMCKKEIVKRKLRHILQKDDKLPKIGARKTYLSIINKNDSKEFLDKFHVQGSGPCSISIGAFFDEKLIGVMTFKTTKNGSSNYELTRFATDYSYRYQGVASKMLSYFIKNYSPTKITSFADKRWTLDKDNNLYTKLGFTLTKTLMPDYRYYNDKVDKYQRFHKFGFRKQVLNKKYGLPLEWTETEMVKYLGYDRIWDCGLFRYELDLKRENV